MLVCIKPEYKEGVGDCTILIYERDEVVLKKNIRYGLRQVAKQYNQDIRELKYKCNRITNLGKLTPIALSSDTILVPIKVRTPRVHRDGGYGYINLFFIEQVYENFILLNNGSKIFFVENRRSIIKRINVAKNLSSTILKIEYSNIVTILNEVLKLNDKLETIILKR
ncbi:MAG: hypothetical protein KatS3mg079_588 [Caloramator sp.]|uniref:ComK protein n=1 Tax=Caloramator proteoclasticus DSM 10124 TaxID=1121262 RepID=A0A1M4SDA7_9CLOT|nr:MULTISPECIES: hypothetical protein [Caloramator]GIW49112.1 MAG: hypothetical protein KatS3mg079_588 [Caloramator sp.]SHE30007.1 hypothetical protein SAMN02746091_00124 [Caloramator proteoclasticus DSM 10124]